MAGLKYPWGDAFDLEKANTFATKIGRISAAGCFPNGASPYGILDMSGNAWEWTRSLWGRVGDKPDYPYPYSRNLKEREELHAAREVARVLRGGSFSNVPRSTRCALRDRGSPNYRYDDYGFRVVVSPFFISSSDSLYTSGL